MLLALLRSRTYWCILCRFRIITHCRYVIMWINLLIDLLYEVLTLFFQSIVIQSLQSLSSRFISLILPFLQKDEKRLNLSSSITNKSLGFPRLRYSLMTWLSSQAKGSGSHLVKDSHPTWAAPSWVAVNLLRGLSQALTMRFTLMEFFFQMNLNNRFILRRWKNIQTRWHSVPSDNTLLPKSNGISLIITPSTLLDRSLWRVSERRRCANSPSFVKSNNPCVSIFKRPTGKFSF